MGQPRWEHFRHDADIGVRGIGNSMAEAFEQAACALSAVITELPRIEPLEAVSLQCSAPDPELLLVDWLNALIYSTATRHLLFRRFRVRISDGSALRGTAWGEALDPSRHRPAVEVKGATYTELQVRQRPDGSWIAQCVVDV